MTTGRINQITLRWRISILSSRRARERSRAPRAALWKGSAVFFYKHAKQRERSFFLACWCGRLSCCFTDRSYPCKSFHCCQFCTVARRPDEFSFSPRPCYHSSEAPTAIQFNSSRPACRRAQTARDTLHSFLLERGAKFLSQPTWQANETDKSGSLVRVARTLLESSSTRLANFFWSLFCKNAWSPTIHTTPNNTTNSFARGLEAASYNVNYKSQPLERSDAWERRPCKTRREATAYQAAAPNRDSAVSDLDAHRGLHL